MGICPPVFGVLDPSDFEIGAKNACEMHIFSMFRFSLKRAFFKVGFLAKSFLAASDRKNADTARGKRVRGVRPNPLMSKNCSFIWEFTGRSLKTGHFSSVSGVFDPSGSHPASAADPRRPSSAAARDGHFWRKTAFRLGNSQVFETLVRRIP